MISRTRMPAALALAALLAAARTEASPDSLATAPRAGAGAFEPSVASDGRAASRDSSRLVSEHFPVVLATYSTTLIGSVPERTANVRLAAAALDGAVLAPGDVLSFNARVGARTLERGYQSAPVILHERRQVQAGGGICQVASTVFVAGLLSGLTPVERWRHSTPVDYIATGQDATIAWGAKDLRVRNDLAQRVRLRIEVLGATLAARIEAEEATPITYELVSDERELPADPGVEDGRPGVEIDLYRVRRESGAETAREFVHRDVIPPSRGARREEPR